MNLSDPQRPTPPRLPDNNTPRAIKMNLKPSSVVWLVAVFLVGIVLIAWLWTSYYTVGAESEGVVLRFGKFLKTVEPGLHFKLPFGIDAVTVLPTRRQLKLEFGFTTPGYLTNPIQTSENPDEEKSMVTGDLNAALVEWVVQYRIEDPRQYLFDVRNPAETLRDLSEAAMREVIGDRTVDELITIGASSVSMRPRVMSRLLVPCFSNMSRRLRSPGPAFTLRR